MTQPNKNGQTVFTNNVIIIGFSKPLHSLKALLSNCNHKSILIYVNLDVVTTSYHPPYIFRTRNARKVFLVKPVHFVVNSCELGDEFHYLFVCPALNNDCKKYLKIYYFNRPNCEKMHVLFNNRNYKTISNVAKFTEVIM